MIWRPFFARVYSRILVKVCAVATATGLVKNKAKKMVFVYFKKIHWLEFQEIWPKNSLETT